MSMRKGVHSWFDASFSCLRFIESGPSLDGILDRYALNDITNILRSKTD